MSSCHSSKFKYFAFYRTLQLTKKLKYLECPCHRYLGNTTIYFKVLSIFNLYIYLRAFENVVWDSYKREIINMNNNSVLHQWLQNIAWCLVVEVVEYLHPSKVHNVTFMLESSIRVCPINWDHKCES